MKPSTRITAPFMGCLLAAFGFWLTPINASAQVSEIRVGIGEFAEDIINIGIEIDNGVENSAALSGEIIFEEPELLRWALSPQPYINASLNLDGDTSFGGAGLLWRQSLGEHFYGDFAFGLVAHTGTTEIDLRELPQDTFLHEWIFRRDNEREFGSRLLFRERLTLGLRLSENVSAEAYFEHISNGGVLGRDNKGDRSRIQGSNSNDGADIVGLGFSWRLD